MGTPLPRDEFPVTRRWLYFNHAGVAPLPAAAADALAAYGREVSDDGMTVSAGQEEREAEVRATAASLLGVPVDDVAFVKNTTEGLSFVAGGLDWDPGDRVVVPACEFPSNLFPWRALADRGVEVVLVEPEGDGETLPVERFVAAADHPRTRLVAASWVQFGRGCRIDVPALGAWCRANDTLFCLDAIQGLGVLPADLAAWGVDFAAADGHKWLLGPEGIGVFYVAAQVRDRLRVLEPGWNAVADRFEYDNRGFVPDPSARRFEGGTMNRAGIAALGASLDLLAATGIESIWRHVEYLGARLVEGLADIGARVLSSRGESERSGIVTFGIDGDDPVAFAEHLRAQGIVVAPRGGGLRVAPHGYNTLDEIDELVDAVGTRAQSTRPGAP